jgi:hypothetical protein
MRCMIYANGLIWFCLGFEGGLVGEDHFLEGRTEQQKQQKIVNEQQSIDSSGLKNNEYTIDRDLVPDSSSQRLCLGFFPKDDDKFDSFCKKIKNPKEVKSICLWQARLTESGFEHITKFRHLQKLRLDACWLGGNSLAYIEQLNELQELLLTSVMVYGNPQLPLSQLKKIRHLRLCGNQWINNASIVKIPILPDLEWLELSHTGVSAEGLKPLKRQPKLQQLNLDGLEISSKALDYLAELPELGILSLKYSRIDAKALDKLAAAQKLSSIDFRHCSSIDDDALSRICKIRTITRLILDNTHVTDTGLEKLQSLDNLKFLSVCGTPVHGKSFGRLLTETKLERLHYNCVFVSGGGIVFLPDGGGIKALQETADGKVTLKSGEIINGGSAARLIDKSSEKPFGLILFHDACWKPIPITCWAFSPDGKYVATATGLKSSEESMGDIRVWDAKTGELVAAVPKRLGYVQHVAFLKDSKTVKYEAQKYFIDGP